MQERDGDRTTGPGPCPASPEDRAGPGRGCSTWRADHVPVQVPAPRGGDPELGAGEQRVVLPVPYLVAEPVEEVDRMGHHIQHVDEGDQTQARRQVPVPGTGHQQWRPVTRQTVVVHPTPITTTTPDRRSSPNTRDGLVMGSSWAYLGGFTMIGGQNDRDPGAVELLRGGVKWVR